MQILGIDIGGSGVKGGVVDVKKGCLVGERLRIPTPDPATPKAVQATVATLVREFSWQGRVGCGFPAAIRNRRALTAANVDPAWIGADVAGLFAEAAGCPFFVLNDADAAGIAEMRFGAGRGRRGVVLVVTVGTGLGSALFSGGVLVPNTEFGHLLVRGKVAEHYASAAVRERKHLSWHKWSKRFNHYLRRLEELIWPDLFIIGGGASKKHDQFFPQLEVRAELLPAQMRNDAGIIGAALTAAEGGLAPGEKEGRR
jgi:polyphosphate glucokinase